MTQVTKAFLKGQIARLNYITKSPIHTYIKVDEKLIAQIGNYHLSEQYGGYGLHRLSNLDGGVSCPLGCGHISKRELSYRIISYINGIIDGMEIS